MKNYVTIKSFPNGISVHLEESAAFEEILAEVVQKFKESGKFFKKSKFAISFEGRPLTEEQERILVNAITKACDICIVCIVGKDHDTNQTFLRALNQVKYESEENTGQFYKGTLKDGQVLETKSGIIILGDVNPGSTIVSKKNIIILGGLYGEAYAGADGDNNHFIAALNMLPEKLRISDCKRTALDKQHRWPIKSKYSPKIAYVMNHQIVVEDIKFTEELLNALLI